ncbi:MAG: T9SS type A sorting domain-containing protein [Candidatus Fermentibacteraceae bacterium]|nr:T9SS type A sorting domain-containing protein [Candidatus Fermentibacteraceae bacterium]MBN2609388.1 T9SS type A sorting domain-containing protein [Candidatus Fermentibacteraceae bacterium]
MGRFVIIVMPLLLLVPPIAADWESTGPPGGPILDLAQSPSSPTVLYLISNNDPVDVMKTTDGGLNWYRVSTMDGTVNCIEVSSNGNVFMAGVEHIWRSVDGGLSWASTGCPSCVIRDIASNVLMPSRVIAIGDTLTGSWHDVMYYWSEDGGATWSDQPFLVSMSQFFGYGAAFSRTDAGFNYQCMYASDIPDKCTVFAGSWMTGYNISPSSTWCPTSIDGRPGDTETILVGTYNGILRTDDLGTNWSTAGGSSSHIYYDVSYSPANGNYAYASSDLSVHRSTDAGQTWTSSSSGLAGWTFLTAVPSCSDQNTVYTTSSAGFFRSTDAGVTWTPSNSGLLIGQSRAMALSPSQPQTVYQAQNGMGVWKSTDNGETWAATTSPFFAGEVCAMAANSDTDVEVLALTSGLYSSPRLYRTTNGGSSWTSVDQHYASAGAVCPDPASAGTYWTAGSVTSGSVQLACVSKTTTSGPPWERDTLTTSDSRLHALAVAPSATSTVYAGGRELGSPALYRTTDGGSTWTKMSATGLFGYIYALAVRPDAPNTVYAGTPQGIFRSTNGGSSFTKVSATIAGVQCIVADPLASALLYLGTESMGVHTSTDGGTTWTPINDGLTNTCVNCLALASGQYLHAGTQGSAGYRLSLSVGIPESEAATLPLFRLSLTPNPSEGSTTALFELPEAGPVRLEVFDLAGRLAAVPISGWLGAGAHNVLWDGRTDSGIMAPNGIYLIRLTAGSRQASARLVLAR